MFNNSKILLSEKTSLSERVIMIIFKTYSKTNENLGFGIEIFENNTCIKRIEDLSNDKKSIDKLIRICNDLQIEKCHIDDIIDDYLTDFSF